MAHLMPDQFLSDLPRGEERLTSQAEIEGRTQAVNIGADINLVTVQRLFGRDIVGRPQNVLVVIFQSKQIDIIVVEARQTEVENSNGAVTLQEDVGRLDIAMDQTGLMSGLKPASGLADIVTGTLSGERSELSNDLL